MECWGILEREKGRKGEREKGRYILPMILILPISPNAPANTYHERLT